MNPDVVEKWGSIAAATDNPQAGITVGKIAEAETRIASWLQRTHRSKKGQRQG
jgi:hypothetical protein